MTESLFAILLKMLPIHVPDVIHNVMIWCLQGKLVNSTRDWTEQETLLLLEVSLTGHWRGRKPVKYGWPIVGHKH